MTELNASLKDRTWEEYRYRHEPIWATIFKLTFSAAFISVIPYLRTEIACVMSFSVLLLPALAFFLCVFGYVRLKRELHALNIVKRIHRELQNTSSEYGEESFTKHAKCFVLVLSAVVLMNAVVLGYVWVDATGGNQGKGAACFARETPNPALQGTRDNAARP